MRLTRLSSFCGLLCLGLVACPAPDEPKPGAGAGETVKVSSNGVRLVDADLYVAQPTGTPAPQRLPSIDQTTLLAGGYSLAEVLEAGQNQFNKPFERTNGWGEGTSGPRSKQRAYWNPRGGQPVVSGTTVTAEPAWPFLRVNGIDSQSCFECHHSIGEFVPPGAKFPPAEVRKPGAQLGVAGGANSAFINSRFPQSTAELGQGAVMTMFVRNPPVIFGTGYTQSLATEMTVEITAQVDSARVVGTQHQGARQSIDLLTKGITYGTFSTTCSGSDVSTCTDDWSGVEGINLPDPTQPPPQQVELVIRPFQWAGIASSVRHFVRDALDFHFSMQAVEKVGNLDCDRDGLIDEMTVGNVSALTAYAAMTRPPQTAVPQGPGLQLMSQVGCTTCHVPEMPIDNAVLTIETPPAASSSCPEEVASLTNASGEKSPLYAEVQGRLEAAKQRAQSLEPVAPGSSPQEIYSKIQSELHAPATGERAAANYQIDLSLIGVAQGDVPAYVWPRIPYTGVNSVAVPVFTDLKVHFMGDALADDFAQGTDVPGYVALPGHYVTRPLWGVGDTDPYLHDGRATTLLMAIEMHGVAGSEAQSVYQAFAALSQADQDAIVDYLEAMKLPIQLGTEMPEYVP